LGSTALQTVINKKNPKKPILYYLPTFTLMARTNPNDCCLLGLGGAGAVQLLSSYPLTITAVDNSDEIIEIARTYFMVDKLPHLNIIHQSAEHYLEQCPTEYGHLLIDLSNALSFPPECKNEHFFLLCKNRLQQHGFLSINLSNPEEQPAMLQLIKKHFTNTLVVPIKKCANMVIIASNHQSKDEFINILLATKEIKKIVLVSSWGYAAEMD
jgi:spermidine synthase